MAEITTCCGSGTCDSIVTIGYMREMAQCATVSSATPFIGCCEAEESAYTPTYGEISGETYADLRKYVNANPVEDTNGFIVELPTIGTNCCEISLDENLVPSSALTFENTTITAVTLNSYIDSENCDPQWSVYKINHCVRHIYWCEDNSISNSGSNANSNEILVDSGGFSKSYGSISTESAGQRKVSIESVVSFIDIPVSTSTTDKCNNTESASTTVTHSDYTVEALLDCSREIPCEGEKCFLYINRDECDELELISAELSNDDEKNGVTIEYNDEESRYELTIPRNEHNHKDTSLIVNIEIGDETAEITVALDRSLCKITPKYEGYVPCGIFPGKDDWSQLIEQGLVEVIDS